jgi:hypothetical protein
MKIGDKFHHPCLPDGVIKYMDDNVVHVSSPLRDDSGGVVVGKEDVREYGYQR